MMHESNNIRIFSIENIYKNQKVNMVIENKTSTKYKNNLELKLKNNFNSQTICQHQYTTYPLRLSPVFRLEGANTERAYLYLINTSPGLLANDTLNLSLHLTPKTNLYLTDQAATKVHPMPKANTVAKISLQIVVEKNSSLEYVPEPIILYEDAVLEQNTTIKLDDNARLFISEIILPGRLAKNEYYDFNYYFNRLEIVDKEDKLLFVDAIRLLGKTNPFKGNKLFASMPIMGNAIAILPDIDLNLLINKLNDKCQVDSQKIEAALTILPAGNGIAIRILANKTKDIKQYLFSVLNCIRQVSYQSKLPYIPK